VSASIARMIDHALLHPTMTDDEMQAGCHLAKRLNLKSVCVKPYAIPLACEILMGSDTAVGTVIGFPHGSHPRQIKAAEAAWALNHGATELDMVINIGLAQQGNWAAVQDDIAAVVDASQPQGAIVKVIFETDYLHEPTVIARLCRLSQAAGADFVKTSTGFGFVKQPGGHYDYQGATVDHIRLMRENCSIGVKASGGVRDFLQAQALIAAGATRIGTSASEAILRGAGRDEKSY
jgi:deoxyribose-phosphate aldolase